MTAADRTVIPVCREDNECATSATRFQVMRPQMIGSITPVSVNALCEEIAVLQTTEFGATIDRPKVVDSLLDLRSSAAGDRQLQHVIDELLRAVPGRNLVESAWFAAALKGLWTAATLSDAVAS